VVSPRTGILKSLALRPKSVDEPVLPVICEAGLSNFDFRTAQTVERVSCGKGLTEEDALLGAIGEALERYCAAHPGADLRRAAYLELAQDAVPPCDLVLYSEAQYARETFPFWRWKPEDRILWTGVRDLADDAPVLAPAAFVYLNAISEHPQDYMLGVNSSGFAAGPDRLTATRAALLEAIERDAFVITWLGRLPATEIELGGIGSPVGDACATYARWGTTIRCFALTTDLPATVVLAIALDDIGKGPAAIIGLGCGMHPADALRKALFEICQMREPLRRNAEAAAAKLNAYADVQTLDQHAAYFFRRDHLHELDFLLRDAPLTHIDRLPDHGGASVEAELETLQRGFARAGCRALYRDLTTVDLEPYPIRVVRALVTELQPIAFGHGLERLGGRRLYQRSGLAEPMLNPCPHPLA
jgi:ribosomal protein S12 methylthiotransferase accessory factor